MIPDESDAKELGGRSVAVRNEMAYRAWQDRGSQRCRLKQPAR